MTRAGYELLIPITVRWGGMDAYGREQCDLLDVLRDGAHGEFSGCGFSTTRKASATRPQSFR